MADSDNNCVRRIDLRGSATAATGSDGSVSAALPAVNTTALLAGLATCRHCGQAADTTGIASVVEENGWLREQNNVFHAQLLELQAKVGALTALAAEYLAEAEADHDRKRKTPALAAAPTRSDATPMAAFNAMPGAVDGSGSADAHRGDENVAPPGRRRSRRRPRPRRRSHASSVDSGQGGRRYGRRPRPPGASAATSGDASDVGDPSSTYAFRLRAVGRPATSTPLALATDRAKAGPAVDENKSFTEVAF